MSYFSYNGVVIHNPRTADYAYEAVMDPSGVDLECIKVTISVETVISPNWTTTNKPRNAIGQASVGDRMGLFLVNTHKRLSEPRGRLEFRVGNDLVIESPQRAEPGDGVGPESALPCDVRAGPFPSNVRITQITGDKAAFLSFTIVTYIQPCPTVLLSNRWSWRNSVDEFGYCSNTISGRARFRKDFLAQDSLEPDDFRHLVVPAPDGNMRRMHVDAWVDPSGQELVYEAHDKAVNWSLGRLGVAKMDVICTGGIQSNINTARDWWDSAGNTVSGLLSGDFERMNRAAVDAVLPHTRASVVARAWGLPWADRRKLSMICYSIALDRFRGAFFTKKDAKPTSNWVTIDWGSDNPPYVEYHADFMVSSVEGAKNWFTSAGAAPTFFNWKFEFEPAKGFESVGSFGAYDCINPGLGFPDTGSPEGSRGHLAGRIVTQLLRPAAVCADPAAPPEPGEGERDEMPREAAYVGLDASDGHDF